jgi:Domain of unknown function (DUF4157)
VLGRCVASPARVRHALERIFGADAPIAQVKVIERSLFARLHWRAVATTRRRRIYLRAGAEAFFADPALMLHEYCHVLLQWETGSLTTARYLLECLRRGYRRNRYEIEARAYAARYAAWLRELLDSYPRIDSRR